MIEVHAQAEDDETAALVEAALVRSFSRAQVTRAPAAADKAGRCAVFINPSRAHGGRLRDICAGPSKVLLLGRLDDEAARLTGVRPSASPADLADWAICPPAPLRGQSESAGRITYAVGGLGASSPLRSRPLLRFDFADEWNNLGYGRVTADGSQWSIAMGATVAASAGAVPVATIAAEHRPEVLLYATLMDRPASSLMWFNRAVGPIDSQEWRLVEMFFSDYRVDELPCLPHFLEIPFGCSSALTMRLDCDEDIASARPLFETYRRRGLPMSLAVMTGQSAAPEHIALLREVKNSGGALLSHSMTHAPHWGGSAASACEEGTLSRQWIEQKVPGAAVRYAVSPFHQTPLYAAAGLARAGYQGVIGATIQCHPDMLLGRAGRIPCLDAPFVLHSQQCMLHGDCMSAAGDPLAIYKEAFVLARRSKSIFGYLDHPFSSRYSYGWASETERASKHEALLDFIMTQANNGDGSGADILFMSEDQCLDFLNWRNRSTVELNGSGGLRLNGPSRPNGLPDLAIGHCGAVIAAESGMCTNA
jgi:hypothetical protein